MNKAKSLLIIFFLIACSSCGDNKAEEKNLSASFPNEDNLTYEQRQGKYLFDQYCAICHGSSGEGDGFNAFNLEPRPRDFTDSSYMAALSDERLEETIAQGGRGAGKSVAMPAWQNTLEPYHISYLVTYLRTFSETK